jgi:hypothetical protein
VSISTKARFGCSVTFANDDEECSALDLTSFMNDTASEMAYWILPVFLVSIGAGPSTLGFIEGISGGGLLCTRS